MAKLRRKATFAFIVDHRERGSPVPRVLEAMEGVRVEFQALPVGDYLVDELVSVEGIGTATAEAIRWVVRDSGKEAW